MSSHELLWTQGGAGKDLPLDCLGRSQDQFETHLALSTWTWSVQSLWGNILGDMVAPLMSLQFHCLPLVTKTGAPTSVYSVLWSCFQCHTVTSEKRPKLPLTLKFALVDQMSQLLCLR